MGEGDSESKVVLEYATPQRKRTLKLPWIEFFVAIGVIALLMSVFLPARSLSRERPNRINCAKNLRQIWRAIELYADSNGGRFPERLDQLITSANADTAMFICPSGSDEKATGTTTAAVVADFGKNGHCSYVYLGAGMTNRIRAQKVVAYEHFENHEREGMNVLYGDGSLLGSEKPNQKEPSVSSRQNSVRRQRDDHYAAVSFNSALSRCNSASSCFRTSAYAGSSYTLFSSCGSFCKSNSSHSFTVL